MTVRETRAVRREQVERCLSSDMKIKDWCEQNGVPASTMYCWMSRLRKEEPELFGEEGGGGWIEVTRESVRAGAAPAGPEAAPAVVVRLNGADVVVPEGSPEPHVAAVLRAVASL